MKSLLVSLPCALAVSLFVSRVILVTLKMPADPTWLFAAVALCTILLYGRSLLELGMIGFLALFAQINAAGIGEHPISPDLMLAILITLVLLPSGMRMLGLEPDDIRTSS
jgi:hypothetical protein